jgi:hypothetical protein
MDETDTSSGTADQLKLIVLMENLLGQGKDYELTEDDVARVFVESGQGTTSFRTAFIPSMVSECGVS